MGINRGKKRKLLEDSPYRYRQVYLKFEDKLDKCSTPAPLSPPLIMLAKYHDNRKTKNYLI